MNAMRTSLHRFWPAFVVAFAFLVGGATFAIADDIGLVRSTCMSLLKQLGIVSASGTYSGLSGTVPETSGGTNQTTYAAGDMLYASATNTLSKLAKGSDTNVLTLSGGLPTWSAPASSGATGTAIYGDGSDGSVTFDGSTTIGTMVPSGSVYTLDRDYYFTSAVVNNGVSVNAASFHIFGNGTLTNGGTIHNNGTNGGTGGSSGVATAGQGGGSAGTGTLGTGGNGGSGGSATSGAAGSAGASPSTSLGGSGAKGGTSTGAHAGGTAGSVSAPSAASGLPRSLPRAMGNLVNGGLFNGGAGGSGGGGDTSHGGGGGGGGGGTLIIAFKSIVNNSVISANGGNGGSALDSTGGVGGGGGGGLVIVLYNTFAGSNPTATHGSNGSTGATTSATTAADGLVIKLGNNQ